MDAGLLQQLHPSGARSRPLLSPEQHNTSRPEGLFSRDASLDMQSFRYYESVAFLSVNERHLRCFCRALVFRLALNIPRECTLAGRFTAHQ
jgi:hypothetical protein